jgi:probable F420-dependent oxidoreductase
MGVPNVGICFIQSAREITPDFVCRLAGKTEETGLHSFWVNDRLTGEHFEPTTLLASVVSVTRNIKLGTSVLLPVLRHPALLAKSLACIDFLSAGRLIVGVGFGGSQREFDAVDIPFAKRGTRAIEQIALMKRLWREDHVIHRGNFFNTTDLSIGPRPTQHPHPPIWMGGAADAVLKRVGALADGYICGTASLKRFAPVWEKIAGAAAANGRDPAAIHKAGITYLTIDESQTRAIRSCEEYLKHYYGKINLDVESETVVGSTGACAERLGALFAGGFETVILRLVNPDLGQLDLLAEKVLPQLPAQKI